MKRSGPFNAIMLFVFLSAICWLFFGCATIDSTTVCPPGTIGTAWGLQGNNVGGQLITMGAAAAHTAGFMARAPGAPPPSPPASTTIKMHYSYGPWFGPDGGNTGCVLPAPATTTINNNQGGTINMPGK